MDGKWHDEWHQQEIARIKNEEKKIYQLSVLSRIVHWYGEYTYTVCTIYTVWIWTRTLFFLPFIILIIIISFCAKRVFISVPFVWFFSLLGNVLPCDVLTMSKFLAIDVCVSCDGISLSASVRRALAFMRSRHTQVKKPLRAKLNDSNLKNNFFFLRSRIFNRNILNLPEFFFSCYQN